MKDIYNNGHKYIGHKMNDYMGAAFLSKYSDLVQKARVDSGEVMGSDAYITTNETSPNSDGVPVSLRESFASSANDIFPSAEMYLGNLDMRVLNDGYVYNHNGTDYDNLTAYLNAMGHNASFKSDQDKFIQCDTANTATGADLTFYCGGEQISQAIYPYEHNALTEKCKDEFESNPSKTYTLTLVYEYSGSGSSPGVVKLVSHDGVIDDAGTNSSEYSLTGSIPNHDDIMAFDADYVMNSTMYKDSLITNENATPPTIELLKANTDTYLKGKDTGGNTMVLLYIDSSGKLTMKFNLKPYRQIGPMSNLKYHGYYKGSDKNVINVYNASDDKYKVGQNMKKNGYVGYDGVFYPDAGKLGDKYEQIAGICYSGTTTGGTLDIEKTSCNETDDCYGIFQSETGSLSHKLINEDNKKYLYKCDTDGVNYYHRKYTTNSDNLACLRDAEDTELISYADHGDLSGNASSTPFDAASHCGYNQLLKDLKADLDSKKDTMDTAFSNLLVEFNSMSADELSWLQKTDSGLNDFKTIVDEHRKLRTEMEGASSKQKLSQAQNRDNKNALETIEYKMAIAGIASICGVITLFQFMKK